MSAVQPVRTRPTPIGRGLGYERSLVWVIGLVLLVLGAAGLVVGSGLFGANRAERPVLDPLVVGWLQQNTAIAVAGGIVLGVVLFALGLWWLGHSLATEPRPNLKLETGPDLVLTSSALTSAVRADAETVTGVNRARVRTAGSANRPNLRLTLSLEEGTDVRHVWEELDEKVLSRARQALQVDALPTAIRLKLDRAPRQRVR